MTNRKSLGLYRSDDGTEYEVIEEQSEVDFSHQQGRGGKPGPVKTLRTACRLQLGYVDAETLKIIGSNQIIRKVR